MDFSNIISFLSLLFAVVAAYVAKRAYDYAILRPDLSMGISQYLRDRDYFYLPIDSKTNRVLLSRPLTEFTIRIKNSGQVSAKYPLVQIEFEGAYFTENQFVGWKAVLHAHGQGYYGFRWSPENTIVYPGLPVTLPILYFAGIGLRGRDFNIVIKYAADGFKLKEVHIPVKLEMR
ncbi:MAG: hypothetical protein RIN56_03095 [Sporomusaceae bacterium]|nr:hypothetical protein [Sporomusaceae bacterium]